MEGLPDGMANRLHSQSLRIQTGHKCSLLFAVALQNKHCFAIRLKYHALQQANGRLGEPLAR